MIQTQVPLYRYTASTRVTPLRSTNKTTTIGVGLKAYNKHMSEQTKSGLGPLHQARVGLDHPEYPEGSKEDTSECDVPVSHTIITQMQIKQVYRVKS